MRANVQIIMQENVGRSVLGIVLLGGASLDGKLPFPLMKKEERFKIAWKIVV